MRKCFKDFEGNHSLGLGWLGWRIRFKARTLTSWPSRPGSWHPKPPNSEVDCSGLGDDGSRLQTELWHLIFPSTQCLNLFIIKMPKIICKNCCVFSSSIVSGTVPFRCLILLIEHACVQASFTFSHTQAGYWWQSSGRVLCHLLCAPTDCCFLTLWIKSRSLRTLRRAMTLLFWMPVTRFLFINAVCSKAVTKCSESSPPYTKANYSVVLP